MYSIDRNRRDITQPGNLKRHIARRFGGARYTELPIGIVSPGPDSAIGLQCKAGVPFGGDRLYIRQAGDLGRPKDAGGGTKPQFPPIILTNCPDCPIATQGQGIPRPTSKRNHCSIPGTKRLIGIGALTEATWSLKAESSATIVTPTPIRIIGVGSAGARCLGQHPQQYPHAQTETENRSYHPCACHDSSCDHLPAASIA